MKRSTLRLRKNQSGALNRCGVGEPAGNEHRFEDILNFLPDATFVIDTSGKVIAWNLAMERLTGLAAGDVIGKGDYEYAIPYYGYRRPILIDLVLRPSKVLRKNYPYIQKDKDILYTDIFIPGMPPAGRHLWAMASPLYNRSGEIIGAIESTRDITGSRKLEHDLIDARACLERDRRSLEQKSAAVREILEQLDAERRRVIDQIQANINRAVMPLLRSLQAKVSPSEKEQIAIVSGYLNDIAAPFTHRLESDFPGLSPREFEVCNLIRKGLSCKEIARTLDTSVFTVLNQRQRIRQKLGLSGKRVNLASYLKTV